MTTLGWWWISSLPAVSLFALLGMVIYFITKRFGPATASLWSLGTLLLMSLIPILALGPTPKWLTLEWKSIEAPDQSPITTASIDLSPQSGPSFPANRGTQIKSANEPLLPQSSNPAPLATPAQVDANNTLPTHAWSLAMSRVPEFLGVLLVLGWCLALVRFALGWWAVKHYLAASEEIKDPLALDGVKAIATKLDFRRPIALRLSKALASAATVGWRNPVVLFPANWESWTQEELKVALAHEISHIVRRDYLSWVLAQLSLTLNFFHPLAHWLLGRLRQNQELAADLLGATICGSREKYLVTLSQLVLDQTHRQTLFLSRPMLSSRGTFLWRIEMLNSKNFKGSPSLTGTRISLLTTFLILVGLGSSGLGLSLGETPAQEKTQGPANPKPSTTPKGKLQGRITAEGTGKPIEGAMVRVLVEGDPEFPAFLELFSDKDGFYSHELPIGNATIFGLFPPPGFYTQDEKTFDFTIIIKKETTVTRNFTLKPGKPWKIELVDYKNENLKTAIISAYIDKGIGLYKYEETYRSIANTKGEAAITIPSRGGNYAFTCQIREAIRRFEIPIVNLKIDPEFDPTQMDGDPEIKTSDSIIRIKDRKGKFTSIKNAQVTNQNGQVVLRIPCKPLEIGSGFKATGSVMDETGTPIAGAKVTATLESDNLRFNSGFSALSDNNGKYTIPDIVLPSSYFKNNERIKLVMIKAGYDGAETKSLNLSDIKKFGIANFETVKLKSGKPLLGKVVDNQGNPVEGAVVSCLDGNFAHSHLKCRTDASGKFKISDLSYGTIPLWASYGDYYGNEKIQFDETTGEILLPLKQNRKDKGNVPPTIFNKNK